MKKYLDIWIEEVKSNKENEVWVFFDEINTCLSLAILIEISINRTYNEENLSENIRLIGAWNPYRKRIVDTEKSGLNRDDDNENEIVYILLNLFHNLYYIMFSVLV